MRNGRREAYVMWLPEPFRFLDYLLMVLVACLFVMLGVAFVQALNGTLWL